MFTFERLRASLSTQSGKKFLATAFVALFVVIGITSSLYGAQAQTPAPTTAGAPAATTPPADPGAGACGTEPLNTICGIVASLLGLFADFVGRLILLVLSVLIAFAQYNDFGNAIPVQEGWVVVRDTTNMFFIIILLLTAFATVIGRDEFHYSKILPKLLLQAVLINFSKTLILLAVDFSQVVMLTFVNAFAQSAAGNFVYALGLDKMMQLGSNIGTMDFGKIIIAYFLAISFMIIALGVVMILTAYLIYRIVALWVTIIIAPLAFFATAVPDKFAASIGALGKEYWNRLTNLLTAGPVIAFFLWLTLAVTQQSNQASNDASVQTVAGGQGLASALRLVRPESAGEQGIIASGADSAVGATFGFLNQIADSAHIASFIVGITMMLMALDTAVASAAAMGGLAAYIGKKTKAAALWTAKLPLSAAGGTLNAIDRRIDATGKLSNIGMKTLGRVPILRNAVRPTLQKGLIYRREEAAKEANAAKASAEEVGKYATDAELKTYGKTFGGFASSLSTLGTRSSRMKVSELLATNAMRDNEAKRNKTSFIDNLKNVAADKKIKITDQEAKAGSETIAKGRAYEEQGALFRSQLNMAKSMNDTDSVEKLEKLMKANPLLAQAGEQRQKAIKDLVDSPDSYKDVDTFNANNGDLLTELMLSSKGWVEDKATGTLKLVDNASWDRKKREIMDSKNTALIQAMDTHENFIKNSGEKKVSELRNIQHRLNPGDKNMQTFALTDSAASTPNMTTGLRVRNATLQKSLDEIQSTVSSGGAAPTSSMITAMSSGATLKEVLDMAGYDMKSNPEPLRSYTAALSRTMSEPARELMALDDSQEEEIENSLADIQPQIDELVSKGKAKSEAEKATYAELRKQKKEITDKINKKYETLKKSATSKASIASRDFFNALDQVDASGITDDIQQPVLAKFLRGGGASFARNSDRLTKKQKASLSKAIKAAVDRYDDIINNQEAGAVLTDDDNAIVQGVQQMREMKNKKGFNPQIKKILTDNPSVTNPS